MLQLYCKVIIILKHEEKNRKETIILKRVNISIKLLASN